MPVLRSAVELRPKLHWPFVLAALLSLAGFYWAGGWWRARSASAAVRSIAVLPFAGADSNQSWLSDGLTAETIDALAAVRGLRVIAAPSTFQLRNMRNLDTIVDKLAVSAILEASVKAEHGRLQLEAQLTRTSDGLRLWTYHAKSARELAAAVAGRIGMSRAAIRLAAHTPSADAYDAYLQGVELFHQAAPGQLQQAALKFEEATRLDPEYARAWAWLSMARDSLVDDVTVRSNQAMPGARDAAERAAALEPNAAETHLALGIVRMQYDWDWQAAKLELDRAVELAPEAAAVVHWRAHWFETQGRLPEAMTEMEHALRLDPLSTEIRADLAREHRAVGQADDYADPTEGAPSEMVGNIRRASEAARKGDLADAQRLIDQGEELHEEQHVPVHAFVELAAALKDWDALFAWLDIGYEERSVQLPFARLNPLIPKADPRFAALLEKMNLPVSY